MSCKFSSYEKKIVQKLANFVMFERFKNGVDWNFLGGTFTCQNTLFGPFKIASGFGQFVTACYAHFTS